MLRFLLAFFWKCFLLLSLFSGSFLLLTSCGRYTASGRTSNQTGKLSARNCDIEVSWAILYSSLKELKRATTLGLAAQGTVTARLRTQSTESERQNTPLSTTFSFKISKLLLDPRRLLTDSFPSITVSQTGGWQGNTLHQVCDDPLFRVGEEMILFLHQSSTGQYFVIGGPSGRFEVDNGIVYPINDEGVKLPAHLTEPQFAAMLQKA